MTMTLTLTNDQIQKLSQAITSLDGGHVVQIIDGRPVSVWRGYKLAHAARWSLALAQGTLQSAVAAFNRAHDSLLGTHSGGEGRLSPSDPRFPRFAEALNELRLQPVELDLPALKLADLNPAENEFPIHVLTALQPLIQTE